MINASYPSYIDYQYIIVGALVGLCYLPSFFFDVPTGEIICSVGKKRLISLGLLGVIIFSLLLPFVDSLVSLFAILLILGFSNQLINVPTRTYVMEISPSKKTAEYFGLLETGMQMGFVVSALLGGALLEEGIIESVDLICILAILTCIGALVLINFGIKETIVGRTSLISGIRSVITTDKFIMKGIREYQTLKSAGIVVLLLALFFVITDSLIWAFEPLYYSLGISTSAMGVILAMFILPFIIFQAPAGYLADRFGKIKLLVFGLLIAGTFLILFGLTRNPNIMLIAAFTSAMGMALIIPAYEGFLTDVSCGKDRGCVVGVWDTAEDFGYIIGPIVGGVIAQFYKDITVPFVLMGAILILLIVPVLLLKKSTTKTY